MKRKLIEVALPLEAINRESSREKSIRHGHPSTLHLWWSRKPLAACRAVIFASLVDDPSSHPDRFPTEAAQQAERQRLFRLIEELVKWENTTNERLLEAAREEIRRSTDGNPPPLLDPFAGGGSIPLEAQRLGLEAYASDLNPVAVLINKALIEIPPRFADQPPVHPDARAGMGASGSWKGAAGLAEDIRRYGGWVRDEAERRIGHLYPKLTLPPEQGGGEATVMAWLWARTVKCPNPACGAEMPLANSFNLVAGPRPRGLRLSSGSDGGFESRIVTGASGITPGTVNRQGGRCFHCGSSVPFSYIRTQGQQVGLGTRLLAMVADTASGRDFFAASESHERAAQAARPNTPADVSLPVNPRDFKTPNYGMRTFAELHTPRQLHALGTVLALVQEVEALVLSDGSKAGLSGKHASDRAAAIRTYLALSLGRSADYWSSLAVWGGSFIAHTFGRQALPMVWDFAEANPFSEASGNYLGAIGWIAGALERVPNSGAVGHAESRDAAEPYPVHDPMVCTDPPYYDNINYGELSDFFYVWLRPAVGADDAVAFSTIVTPKEKEIGVNPYRFEGRRRAAEEHFRARLTLALRQIAISARSDIPTTIFYAFKQSESAGSDHVPVSTGWERMLESLLAAELSIEATWPIRSERSGRMSARNVNALASSIVLVCRPRAVDAGITDRKAFLAELRNELPDALRLLQHGNIAPVDLAQASIGPGMAVFSRYAKVVEPTGDPMTVRTALGLINQVLGEVLTEQEDDFDADTRWAITWFEQHRYGEGKYGEAEVLARAKDVGVNGLLEAGIVGQRPGYVRLLRSEELRPDWDPATDRRTPIWEITQRLIYALNAGGGAEAAADIARRTGGRAEIAKELAYRLYVTCERKNWADEGRDFNSLVVDWPEITKLASGIGPGQTELGLGG